MRNISEFSKVLSWMRQKPGGSGGVLSFLKKDKQLHLSSPQKYPAAAALPIPPNIDTAETTRFSPQRSRDISATAIISHQSNPVPKLDITLDSTNNDPHVESYDCFGAVSLNSAMQSNVPSPFGGLHKFTHLNMPGGQWSQENKFMSHDLQSSHYMNLRREVRSGWSNYDQDATNKKDIDRSKNLDTKENENEKQKQTLSRKEQLKQAVKDYGSTVIIFHVGISLISLGCFYLLVTSGINLMPIIETLGLGSTSLSNNVVTGASSFVIAYAIHKVFAPARISITLAATPFIVRYLRKRGVLKMKSA